MSKYTIYRQAAIDALDEIDNEVADGLGFQYDKWRQVFEKMPSAQPEIIRCGECKWLGEPSPFIKDKYDCKIVDRLVNVDSFCSWAERREE